MFTVHRPPAPPLQAVRIEVHFPDGVLALEALGERLACLSRGNASVGERQCTLALRNGGANDLRLGLAPFTGDRREPVGTGALSLQVDGLDATPQPWGDTQIVVRLGQMDVEVSADHRWTEVGLFFVPDPQAGRQPRFLVHPCGANCFSIGLH